jgi:hypothetical protein
MCVAIAQQDRHSAALELPDSEVGFAILPEVGSDNRERVVV